MYQLEPIKLNLGFMGKSGSGGLSRRLLRRGQARPSNAASSAVASGPLGQANLLAVGDMCLVGIRSRCGAICAYCLRGICD